jgi:hypothetical protein
LATGAPVVPCGYVGAVLIFGLSVSEALLSTLIYTCETCGNSAAHRLVKRTRRFTLFFLPLFPVGTTYVDTCAACGRLIEVSRDRAEAAAYQTGPELR